MTSGSKKAALSAGVVVLLIGVFFLGRISESTPEGSSQEREASIAGPSGVVNGVQVGYEQSEIGAVAAASNFARVMAKASTSDSFDGQVRTIASPEWVDEALALAASGRSFFADRYGAGGSLSFVPIKYRIGSFSETRASVAIWGVSLALDSAAQAIEESWVTGNLDLEWISGDWRVVGQSSEPGPTPELLRSGGSLDANFLAGFEEYEIAPHP